MVKDSGLRANDLIRLTFGASSDSMLIRLEAINEVNFDSLLSTIRRLNKDWEITKVIGESFLKIYI